MKIYYRSYVINQEHPESRCTVQGRRPERAMMAFAADPKGAMRWIDRDVIRQKVEDARLAPPWGTVHLVGNARSNALSSRCPTTGGGDEKIGQQARYEGPDIFGAFLRSKIVNLSYPVSPQTPRWPGDPPVEFAPWANIRRDGYYLRRFSMSEHGGTHLTAPASFYPDGRTVDQYAPDELVKPAVVIDVREQCRDYPDYALTVADLMAWESRHGIIPADSVALLLTGWSKFWDSPAAYLGLDEEGGLHFPGFGPEAAAHLVNERGIVGLGTDTAGVEPGVDDSFTVSKLVLAQPRIVLENLANLHHLPPTGAVVVIGLLRLTGGSGSPAAVTAFLPPASGL